METEASEFVAKPLKALPRFLLAGVALKSLRVQSIPILEIPIGRVMHIRKAADGKIGMKVLVSGICCMMD